MSNGPCCPKCSAIQDLRPNWVKLMMAQCCCHNAPSSQVAPDPFLDRALSAEREARLWEWDGEHAAPGQIREIFEASSYRCYYCRSHGDMVLDHKTPLARGGSNGPENIACACAGCKLLKGSRTAEEFFHQRKLNSDKGLGQ